MKQLAMKAHVRMMLAKSAFDDRGATAVEYALLVGLIAVAIIVAVMAFSGSIQSLFNSAAVEVTKSR